MHIAQLDDVELEYEVTGSGEPVLLISPVLADGFVPLISEPALADYQLIRYHKRGWVGSTHTPPPVSVVDHAADAAGLLHHLGVHTLTLLELSLLSLPGAQAFFEHAGPAFETYGTGDHEQALALFMGAVSGLDWATCRALLEQRVPGAVAQAMKDVDTFFGVELPALTQWTFGPEQAAAIDQPVLSVLGSETQPLWVEVAEFLRSSLPHVEECTIAGVGHLLHLQRPEPVAQAIAQFLGRNPLPGD
jgi:pimeloyl-ACP methyl ester carboxylesterase